MNNYLNDYIGRLVKPFESGNLGILAFGNCGNDYGLSCGSYQLTLRWGNCIYFLKSNYPREAEKLYWNNLPDKASHSWPGVAYCSSPAEVKAVWVQCVKRDGEAAFFNKEHDWIRRAYYDPILNNIKAVFNPNSHSRMAQECMWSWAVHRGASGAYIEFTEAVKGKDPQSMPGNQLIDILYDERYRRVPVNRYKKGINPIYSERETLRSYCAVAPLAYPGSASAPVTAQIVHIVKPGDTLWALAVKYLKNGNRWPEIQQLNKITGTIINVGQKLNIPNK